MPAAVEDLTGRLCGALMAVFTGGLFASIDPLGEIIKWKQKQRRGKRGGTQAGALLLKE